MSELKPGQSLTPKQVRSLPDGAAIEAVLLDGIRYDVEVNSSIRRLVEGFLTTAQWKDCILVSLPPAPSEPTMPDFDPHGLPEANNEIISKKLGQSPENATEPSPGEGCRWVEAGKNLRHGDEWKMTDGPWILWTVDRGDVSDGTYRRRIEPQAESPSVVPLLFNPTTPRAASEIEREAAIDSISLRVRRIIDLVCDGHVEGAKIGDGKQLIKLCKSLISAHEYAVSIGAVPGSIGDIE